MTYDHTNRVTIQLEPVPYGHTRYVLVLGDAPSIVNIDGLIDFWVALQDEDSAAAAEDLRAILILTPEGESEPVHILKDRGHWVVTQMGNEGSVIEAIQYDPDDEDNVLHHEVYVTTFTTDQVPMFNVAGQRS